MYCSTHSHFLLHLFTSTIKKLVVGPMGKQWKGMNTIMMNKVEKNNSEDKKESYHGSNPFISQINCILPKRYFFLNPEIMRLSLDLKQYPPQMKICIMTN